MGRADSLAHGGGVMKTPFYCGTQGADWELANCDNCKKGGRYTDEKQMDWVWLCDIQKAKDEAYMGDGSVSNDIARRMGYDDGANLHNWPCTELDPIEPIEQYFARFAPKPTRLASLWKRLKRAAEFAWEMYDPWWQPEVDIYGVMGRIELRLAWRIAWGMHHDDREVIR